MEVLEGAENKRQKAYLKKKQKTFQIMEGK